MKNVEKYEKQVKDFLAVCRLLGERVYVTSHGGNLSCRLEDDLLLITPTRVYKGNLKKEDLVFIDLEGNIIEGAMKPSGETPMYLNFFRERPDINSVIHCHPPVTNAFAITKGRNWLMRPIFPETVVEVGPVPVVPYGEPLTQRLADNFKPYLQKYNAFLMESHGLVIMSPGDIVEGVRAYGHSGNFCGFDFARTGGRGNPGDFKRRCEESRKHDENTTSADDRQSRAK